MQLLLGLGTGIVFGYILQRVGVAQCACLFNALSLKNTKAIKVIATAIATGIIIVYPLASLGVISLGARTLYVGGVVVGGALFGLGFAMAGLCPGTALAALGGGMKDVLYLVAGALVGSFVFSLSYDSMRPALIDSLNYGGVTIPQLLNTSPLVTGYVVAALLIAAAVLLDRRDRQSGAIDGEACTIAPRTDQPTLNV